MITAKEYAAMHYMLNQIYASDMLIQLNDEGEYSYTMEDVRRCIAMIRNGCGL